MIYLHRKDIEKIVNIMNKFPDVDNCKLEQDSSSGIGSITTITLGLKLEGHEGQFKIVVSGEENW